MAILAIIFFQVNVVIHFLRRGEIDWKMAKVLLGLMGIGVILSAINAFWFPLKGADMDALAFFNKARVLAETSKPWRFLFGSGFYTVFLSIVFYVCGTSMFLGGLLSLTASLFSALGIIKVGKTLNLSDTVCFWSVVIFRVLPTNLVMSSVTLREAFETAFLIWTIYYCLIFIKLSNWKNWLKILVCAFFMGVLHNGLFVLTFIVYASTTFWMLFTYRKKIVKDIRILLALVLVGYSCFNYLGEVSSFSKGALQVLLGKTDDNILVYVQRYRSAQPRDSRTNFFPTNKLNTNSWGDFIKSSALIYFYYQFAPFPWKIENFFDLYASLESLLRMALILFSFLFFKLSPRFPKKTHILTLYFLIITGMFALGTVNFGNAIRHHVLTNWIIILLGLSGINALGPRLREILGKKLHSVS